MGIDEGHLCDERSSTFLVGYRGIKNSCCILPSLVTLVAVTGKAAPSRARAIAAELGFHGNYIYAKYLVDRPNIKYIPLFFEHAYTGPIRHDFDKFIPYEMHSLDGMKPTIIFLEHYDEGYALMNHLESLLPANIPNPLKVIKMYSGFFQIDYRTEVLQDVSSGITRILIVTDTCTYGLDIPSLEVVVVGSMCPTLENLKQKMGWPG
jgi:hypothetical protein